MNLRILLLLLAVSPALRAAEQEPSRETVKEAIQAFRPGHIALVSYQARPGEERDYRTAVVSYAHGWESGVSAVVSIPFVLKDTRPNPAGARTPRLGGGLLNRPQVSGYFRLLGDGYDYFGLELGAAVPWQTDPAMRNSVSNTWIIIASAFFQLDWKWISWKATISDYPSIPSQVELAGLNWYIDVDALVFATTTVQLFPHRSVSPYVLYAEVLPTRYGLVTDHPSAAFTYLEVTSGRTRVVQAGVDTKPQGFPAVISLDVVHFIESAEPSDWQYIGRLRWLF